MQLQNPNVKGCFKTTIFYQKLFIRFLKEMHVYNAFKYNLEHYPLKYRGIKLLNSFHPSDYLYYAFSWAATKEHFNFWADVNIRWQKKLISFQK